MHSALPPFANPPPGLSLAGLRDFVAAVTPTFPDTAAGAIVPGLALCGIHLAIVKRVPLTSPRCGAVSPDPTGDRP